MSDEIEKSEQPNPDDVLAAITSFNDPAIIINLFRQLGWSYTVEIKETIALAQQNANLSIKFKALKYLRELLREAAETSGYIASVSQTVPNPQGGVTSFHAKRIANILNPTKQIESNVKETQNGKKETRTEPNRESDRGQSQTKDPGESEPDSSESIRDTRRAFPSGDVESGRIEPQDRGETSGRPGIISNKSGNPRADDDDSDSEESNPCIQTRLPNCDRDLYPGISSAGD